MSLSCLKRAPVILVVAANTIAVQRVSAEEPVEISLDTIVVTASRLQQDGFTAPTPLNVFTSADLEARGTPSLLEALTSSPFFVDGSSPRTQGISAVGNTSELDLRGLGPKRTLVLVNGRRHVAATTDGTVNVELIPASLIERIDVVTGGASAAWGSDAVSGVVNVVYKQDFVGFEIDAQGGISGRGDNEEHRTSLLMGDEVAGGRGHLMVAAEAYRSAGITEQSSRPWFEGWQIIANPANTSETDGIASQVMRRNVRFLGVSPGGVLVDAGGSVLSSGPFANMQFGVGGALEPYTSGGEGAGLFGVGGDGVSLSAAIPLVIPNDRRSIYATYEHELGERTELYFEGSIARASARIASIPGLHFAPGGGFGIVPLEIDNPFLPASVRQTMLSEGIDTLYLGRADYDIGRMNVENESVTHRAVLGLTGSFAHSWTWDVSYQYSQNDFDNVLRGNPLPGNFALAVDAVTGPDGRPACRSGAPGCVPLNVIGSGAPDVEAIDYVTGNAVRKDLIQQDSIAAVVRGTLLELPAGALSLAAGAEYRRDSGTTTFDQSSEEGHYLIGNGRSLSGSIEVNEAFAEVLLPIARDLPGVHLAELNLAGRYTDYSTIGAVNTHKLGGSWMPVADLRLRGTYSRDIRAPNIGELFLGVRQGFSSLSSDPCSDTQRAANPAYEASCSAQGVPGSVTPASIVSNPFGGNPDLREERARTQTFGMIYTPSWLPGFDLSIDYYDIDVKGAIGGLPLQVIVNECYGSNNSQLCSAITRAADGNIVRVLQSSFNVASLATRGVDWHARYGFGLSDLFSDARGRINLDLTGTYVDTRTQSPDGRSKLELAGEVGTNNGLGGTPHWRWNLSAGYERGAGALSARVRYIGGGKIDNTWTAEDIEGNTISAQYYLDASAYYDFALADRKVRLFGGVSNVLDRSPPVMPTNFILTYATNPGLYDTVGRSFFLGARLTF